MNQEKISILENYAEELTNKEYFTNPAIAREEEIKRLLLVLLTPEKSAILVGKPGIGKTSIVEGLSFQMQLGNVPNAFKGYRIFKINTSSLLGTIETNGATDSKLQLFVDELKNHEKLIVFIDEIHTLITSSGKTGIDFINTLKPGLDRGTIKIIGATTTQEFEQYLLRDKAFLRRFEKIEVSEPSPESTVQIMMGTYPKIEKQTGVKLGYPSYINKKLFDFLVNMTSEYKRVYEISSRYPDISLSLLTKAFSLAVYENSEYVTFKHIYKAIITCQSVYPDVIKKELVIFENLFSEQLKQERVIIEPFNG